MSAATFSIVDFGAKSGSDTLATAAIQAAIDAAERNGGGTVIVPPGVFRSSTIFLKSNVTLDILANARLLAAAHIEDYPEMAWKRQGDRNSYHFIVIDNAEGVTLCGRGTIDGCGPAFWNAPENPRDWILPKSPRPSPMIEVRQSRDVRIEDLHITDAPGWTLHLHECDQIRISGITIRNNLLGPNNDGVDIGGSRDVIISDCNMECCDDCITMKTYANSRSCERIVITNCILRTNCFGVKIGTETHQDVRQVTFSNSVVYNSGKAFAVVCLDSGVVEDVAISNIVCDTNTDLVLNRPIHLDLRQRATSSGQTPGKLGRVRNITISNVIARTNGRILLTAADGGVLENVTLRDIQLRFPRVEDPAPVAPQHACGQSSNKSPNALAARAAVSCSNMRNFNLAGLVVTWPEDDGVFEDWWSGDRREGGGFKRYPPVDENYPPMHVVWAENVSGLLDVPLAHASHKNHPPLMLKGCSLIVRN